MPQALTGKPWKPQRDRVSRGMRWSSTDSAQRYSRMKNPLGPPNRQPLVILERKINWNTKRELDEVGR